jgi:hypothetical protein
MAQETPRIVVTEEKIDGLSDCVEDALRDERVEWQPRGGGGNGEFVTLVGAGSG